MRALMSAAACCAVALASAPGALAGPEEGPRPLTPEELSQIRNRAKAGQAPERPQALLLIAPRISLAIPVAGTAPGPSAGLDIEYVTPFFNRRLAIAAQAQWTALSYQHQALPFVADTAFQTRVRQGAGIVAAVFRTTGLGKGGEAYAGAGPGIFATSVETAFGKGRRREHDLRAGLAGFAGVDLYAGPGSIFLEVNGQYAPSSLPALGRSSVVPLSFGVGYRFVVPR
ncbi:MAG: hypothetical protein NVS4B10_13010 [Myxococcales bacterium]